MQIFSPIAIPISKLLVNNKHIDFQALSVDKKVAVERLNFLLRNPSVFATPTAICHLTIKTNAGDALFLCILW